MLWEFRGWSVRGWILRDWSVRGWSVRGWSNNGWSVPCVRVPVCAPFHSCWHSHMPCPVTTPPPCPAVACEPLAYRRIAVGRGTLQLAARCALSYVSCRPPRWKGNVHAATSSAGPVGFPNWGDLKNGLGTHCACPYACGSSRQEQCPLVCCCCCLVGYACVVQRATRLVAAAKGAQGAGAGPWSMRPALFLTPMSDHHLGVCQRVLALVRAQVCELAALRFSVVPHGPARVLFALGRLVWRQGCWFKLVLCRCCGVTDSLGQPNRRNGHCVQVGKGALTFRDPWCGGG